MKDTEEVSELVGIYDADGTITGELTYLWRRAVGRGHCTLCEISHGALRRRRSFDLAAARLPVPLRLLHRDELDDRQAAATKGEIPCVLATGSFGMEVIVRRSEIESDVRDADHLVNLLLQRLPGPS